MVAEIFVLGGLALLIGLAVWLADTRLPQQSESPAERVNQLLPQSQCGQCGYPGCRPYAEAIIAGDADIDQCAPGGDRTVTALANLLGRAAVGVNPVYGSPGPAQVAVINDSACIGCTLCIAACPVDAIVGAAQHAHTVLRDECTGCELCIPPCPVDCIALRLRLPQRVAA
ncbi:MAG: RnfABCDGE type electron transport complex subunit B [Gammaproteobacteria bacterium]|nr:RnfABCDGE type electron transport complex subunit B [Gammaproteobacteria bacterium]